ncbi:MAG: Glu/Leu/Phe/Val dehydrogenase [Rhodospirillaceae bacterium]|nr:Glu/Leu/Phe/Val dehydrogenase [Rhodospirillaceae bacterium]
MSVFENDYFDQHEVIAYHEDGDTGLRAIIAIHNTALGPALGGCRMWPYASEEDALVDVLRLSRGMTYKAAISGIPFGGGKAVIIGDSRTQKTGASMRAYGRFVDTLGGRYLTAEDVGTTVADMKQVRATTRHVRGFGDGSQDPSPTTAYGVFIGIKAALAYRFGIDSVSRRTVAVQGLGNVGMQLVRYLAEEGASLIVADLDRGRVESAIREYGAAAMAAERIHQADVDVFAPCALGAVVNDTTVDEIMAEIVAGSANNQLVGPEHGLRLMERGILYAPDYVINAGGVIDVAGEGPDYRLEDVMSRVARIGGTLGDIFERAAQEGRPPERIADVIAEERFKESRKQAA